MAKPARLLKTGNRGDDVRELQRSLNVRRRLRSLPLIDADGVYGPQTDAAVRDMAYRLGALDSTVRRGATVGVQRMIRWPGERTRGQRSRAEQRKRAPMRLRAFAEAAALLGVVEKGGNNRGPEVDRIIRENGGQLGEPWCGDFVAYVYRRAGSKAVNRSWASVYFLGRLAGVERTTDPQRGDLVRFTFSHVGLFDKWVDRAAGVFLTIEGNTGRTGAVSDSASGGDGVKRKKRYVAQVTDFRRVTK